MNLTIRQITNPYTEKLAWYVRLADGLNVTLNEGWAVDVSSALEFAELFMRQEAEHG
jgi:hypothetical protein